MSTQKNIIWFSFGNITYLGTQWLITVLVARGSGLNDAGILSLAMSISSTFQTIAFFGMRNYQVSDIEKKYSDLTYIQSRFLTCFAALFSCGIFVLVNRYRASQSIAILLFMCFRLSEAFSDVFHGILQKSDRLDLAGKGYFYKGTVIITFFSVGYYLFKSLYIGLGLMTLGAILATFFYDLKNTGHISLFDIDWKEGTECDGLLKETVSLCICMCLQSAISTAPKYILERMRDGTALGAYSSIFAPALIIQAAASYIFTPFVGQFSRYYQNGEVEKFKKLLFKIGQYIILMGLITVFCVQSVGWKLLNIVFGTVISGYEHLLIPILFCTFANAFFAFCNMLSIVIRDFFGQVIACSLGFVLCIVSTIICISEFEINGASYGLLIGSVFASSILIFRIFFAISQLGQIKR